MIKFFTKNLMLIICMCCILYAYNYFKIEFSKTIVPPKMALQVENSNEAYNQMKQYELLQERLFMIKFVIIIFIIMCMVNINKKELKLLISKCIIKLNKIELK